MVEIKDFVPSSSFFFCSKEFRIFLHFSPARCAAKWHRGVCFYRSFGRERFAWKILPVGSFGGRNAVHFAACSWRFFAPTSAVRFAACSWRFFAPMSAVHFAACSWRVFLFCPDERLRCFCATRAFLIPRMRRDFSPLPVGSHSRSGRAAYAVPWPHRRI